MVKIRTAGALVLIVVVIALVYLFGSASTAGYTNAPKTSDTSSLHTTIASTVSSETTSVNAITTTYKSSTPPKVTITSPQNVSTVNGLVNITANIIDSSGIRQVQFYIDGNLSWTKNSTPYYYLWNTTGLMGKQYTITVKAYDYNDTEGQANVLVDIGLIQHGK